METLKFNLARNDGKFKIMHAVNNGPVYTRYTGGVPQRNNFEEYKALGIPYARNHDASFYDAYGGEHTVDISAIFPNFDADVNDPASYDFVCTDEYIAVTALAGTETFYRLGQKIEHTIKKFHIHQPKDFKKWAEICHPCRNLMGLSQGDNLSTVTKTDSSATPQNDTVEMHVPR